MPPRELRSGEEVVTIPLASEVGRHPRTLRPASKRLLASSGHGYPDHAPLIVTYPSATLR